MRGNDGGLLRGNDGGFLCGMELKKTFALKMAAREHGAAIRAEIKRRVA